MVFICPIPRLILRHPTSVLPPRTSAPATDVPAHKPYIPDDKIIPEFTWSAVIVGAVLGIIFGASSLYLVLKVGMTISASIPVAVLSITLFRGIFQNIRHPPGDDSGKQHRTNHRVGRRIDRLWRGHYHARGDDLGLRNGNLANDGGFDPWRRAGHLDDDPSSPGVYRQAARHIEISRGHGLRRRAGDRRDRRIDRQDRIHRFRLGLYS